MPSFLRVIAVSLAAQLAAGCGAERAPPAPDRGPPPVYDDREGMPFGAPWAPEVASHPGTRAAPALSGGTLLALRDDRTAAASDPDLDLVWLVDLRGGAAPRRVALRRGDEPGRLVEDDRGRIHVVLRRGAAVATIDAAGAAVIDRRPVCPAPRGIVWNAALARLHVVCAGGEFVTLPGGGGAAVVDSLAGDLRDVVVHEGAVYVSRFRAATIWRVELAAGRATGLAPVAVPDQAATAVAWRMASVAGGLVTLSQAVQSFTLGAAPSRRGYYGDVTQRTAPMAPRVRVVASLGEQGLDATVSDGGLTVDVAAARDGDHWRIAVASPGWGFRQGIAQVREWTLAPWTGQRTLGPEDAARSLRLAGQAVAVAYTPSRELVVQTRAPGRIVVSGRVIPLSDDDVTDEGHDVFHAATLSGLACASCHPEGADDGLNWNFVNTGLRRTPSLRGGILQTAPFHWSGDLPTIDALASTVFTARMGGGPLRASSSAALGRWIDTLPALPVPARDPAAVARGEAMFRDATVGCASCHGGLMLTNNQSVDVGTRGIFQVPPLIGLAHRAPYMHDGCAPTLMARFTDAACGGGERHGRTAHLSPAQLADLVAYLESR